VAIRFVDEAQRELLDAISDYERAHAGLGQRFKDDVDRYVLWAADHGELYRLRRADIAVSTFRSSRTTFLTL
jgi:hypothetical protein